MMKQLLQYFRHHMETVAAAAYVCLMTWGGMAGTIFIPWCILFSPSLRIPCILYSIWHYFDSKTMETGRNLSNWLRNFVWWRYAANYFPVKLIKTTDLSPDESYLCVTCPHGIYSIGSFAAFGTDVGGFQQIFPGLKQRQATAKFMIGCPITREMSLSLGLILASEKTMLRYLNEKGNAIGLLPGGAEEAYFSKPRQYKTVLGRRKGFVRVALKSGANLVPTISFGENEEEQLDNPKCFRLFFLTTNAFSLEKLPTLPDCERRLRANFPGLPQILQLGKITANNVQRIFEQLQLEKGSILRRMQDFFKKLTGVAPVFHYGRDYFRLVPFKKPIHVVFGEPIKLTKVEEPDQKQIDEVHSLFCEKLKELFEEEKFKYLENPAEIHLEFV